MGGYVLGSFDFLGEIEGRFCLKLMFIGYQKEDQGGLYEFGGFRRINQVIRGDQLLLSLI